MSRSEPTRWQAITRSAARALANPDNWLVAAFLAAMAYALYSSSFWRMRHDLPMMMYQAMITNRFGLLPYRDFFDMNMPGTYWTYRLIGSVFGYTDWAVRLADWTWIALLWGATFAFLRGLPWKTTAAGLALFTLMYLRLGGGLTLQREFLALPVLALGLWGAFLPAEFRWRALLAGVAIGVAATYKPHLILGVVPVAIYVSWEAGLEAPRERRRGAIARTAGWLALGVALPLLGVALWLTWHGLWEPFLWSLQYLVYYGQLNGDHVAMTPDDRPAYLLGQTLRLGGHIALLVGAALGVTVASTMAGLTPALQRRLNLLVGLAAVFAIYPAASGQFWNYHWLPLVYVSMLCMGLVFAPAVPGTPIVARALPRVIVALFFLQLIDASNTMQAYRARPLRIPASGRPDRIAKFLDAHLEPGDVVQPYDWVSGGVVQGMLIARARPATPYLYTFHFYHHVSTRYIQILRKDFVDHLETTRPAFIVTSRATWPFVRGPDTARAFPEYDAWLEENYLIAQRGPLLTIYERTDHLYARGGEPFIPGEPNDDVCDPDDEILVTAEQPGLRDFFETAAAVKRMEAAEVDETPVDGGVLDEGTFEDDPGFDDEATFEDAGPGGEANHLNVWSAPGQ